LGVDEDYVVGDLDGGSVTGTTPAGTAAGGAGLSGGDGGAGLSAGGSGGTGLSGGGTAGGGLSTGGTGGTGLTGAGTSTGTGTPTAVGGGTQIVEVRIANGADDVEECLVAGDHCAAPGSIYDYSTDLEMTNDPPWAGPQVVGIRFPNAGVPQGAIITDAYVEFQADGASGLLTNLTIHGHDADTGTAFSAALGDVTNRPTTSASVDWAPTSWSNNTNYQTPNLAPIVQELANRPGWSTSSAVVLIISGSGTRIAESYEGEAQNAPLLHVEFVP
jgi:hypothetical protein